MVGRSTVKRARKLLGAVTAASLVLQTLAPLAPIGQASPAYAAPAEAAQERVPINVKLKPSANGADVDQTVRGAGGQTKRDLAQLRTRTVEVPADKRDQVLAALSKQPSVERADAAIKLAKAGTPNDPAYAQQWALPKMGWDQAYGTVPVNGSAKIAVLDTGVDGTHPDLAGRLAAGESFTGGNPQTDPNGHGTALAGIAAANVNNAAGIAGVAYAGASVSSVQVLQSDGSGWDSDVVAGVLWAADHGAQVILMGFSSPSYSPALADALAHASSKGAVLVAATGNSGSTAASYPAGMPNVIGVAATDSNDTVLASSNTGSAAVTAPGQAIAATWPGGGYVSVEGTSAASAQAAGLAALLVAGGKNNTDASNQIRGATDPVAGQSFGRINVAKALGAAIEPAPTPTVAPTPTPGTSPTYEVAVTESITGTWNETSRTLSWTAANLNSQKCYGVTLTNSAGAVIGATPSFQLGVQGGSTRSGSFTIDLSTNPPGRYKLHLNSDAGCNISIQRSTDASVDVTITNTTTAVAAANGIYGGTAMLSATLTSAGSPVSGQTINFTLNGNRVGSGTTNVSGIAAITVSLSSNGTASGTLINAGTYDPAIDPTKGVGASFLPAQTSAYKESSGANTLTVNPAGTTTTVANASATYGASSVTLTATVGANSPSTATVNQGAVTFTIKNSQGGTVGSPTSGNVSSGSASVNYSLPGNHATGTYTIEAVYNPLTTGANFTRSSDTSKTLIISASSSSLTVAAVSGVYRGTVQLSATLTSGSVGVSGKTITFSVGNTSLGTATTGTDGVAQTTVTLPASLAASTTAYPLTATFAGDSQYSGSSNTNTLTVGKASQTISFPALTNKTYGDAPFTVSATASSDLAVSFTATGQCTISGSTVTITGAGSCTVTASQAGDSNYNAAPNVDRTFSISKATATLSFSDLTHTYDGTGKAATATTDPEGLSGVSISYTQNGQSVASPTNAGSYAVRATLSNANYAAEDASGTLVINKGTATVTLGSLTHTYDGTGKAATATTDPEGLTVNFAYSQNSQSVVSPTNAGSYSVVATIDNGNYAGRASGTLVISKASASLSLSNLSHTFDGTAKAATATTSPSGLTGVSVSYSQNGNPVTDPTNAGSYAVRASLDNANYTAEDVTGTLVINKASQTIDFAALTNKTYGDAPFAVSATASSGLAVNFAVGATDNCTIAGNTVTITGAGSCTVTASQAGNDNYHAATSVARTFAINRAATSLVANAATGIYGGTTTLKAFLGTPAGSGLSGRTISFTLNGNTVGNATTDAQGIATLTNVSLAGINAGTYNSGVSATFAGETNYANSTGINSLTILYGWNGFLQPINDTAHQMGVTQSKFKLGQTIPAKFNIKDAAGNSVQQATNPTFTRSATPIRPTCDASAITETVESVSSDGSPEYKWTGSQYQYNWNTKGLAAGVYRIYANLDDRSAPWVDICLTK